MPATCFDRVQARDKDSGLPVWSVDVMDFDPDARERTFKIKIAAAVRPVVLEGLTVTPYIKEGNRPKIGYSLRATGLAAPGRGRWTGCRRGLPSPAARIPCAGDYRRAALDALHFPKLAERLWEKLRRCAGYNVQYFGAIEAQKRLAAHLHVALRLRVSDDGVGGAQPDEGTGLTGLRDRVEALGGSIDVTSPAGSGTVLNASLPIEPTSGATGASEVS